MVGFLQFADSSVEETTSAFGSWRSGGHTSYRQKLALKYSNTNSSKILSPLEELRPTVKQLITQPFCKINPNSFKVEEMDDYFS